MAISSNNNADSITEYFNLALTDASRFQLRSGQNYIRHDAEAGVGYEFLCQLQPGILLRVMEFSRTGHVIGTEDEETIIPGKKLIMSFRLVGNSKFHLAENNTDVVKSAADIEKLTSFEMYERSMLISYCEEQVCLTDSVEKDEHYLLVMLICDLQVLYKKPFGLQEEQLPQCIQSILQGKQYTISAFTMNDDIVQALRILMNTDTSHPCSRAFLQAKTVELMCLALFNIAQQENQQDQEYISNKEREQMAGASQLLLQGLQSPPSVEELATTLGLSQSRLKRCFKALHGCSISDYIMNARMQHARQLLTEGQLNVTQVAMEVGYEHVCNFSTTFKRESGITPKAFQKLATGRK
ncbi:hypothetical protein R50073_06830 [Maricurvus nonylphenolicus]|uniref:helix-turn-helix domain-containing protein n=1 Tax=Maricurvus nonylphenolicus TaxID=1008307 RepID=UPI0036F39657